MKTSRAVIALGALAALIAGALPATATVDRSDNVKRIAHITYDGVDENDRFFTSGTDIAFSGKYVYAMQQGPNGGVHVVENSKKPREVAFIECPGEQNDVAVVKPGLIALGYHSSTCGGVPGGGIRLIDVKDPKNPKYLGAVAVPPGGTHTLTVYPGTNYIYSSPNGLGNPRGTETIVDVSNPNKPEIVGTFPNTANSCHDLTFYIGKDRKLAFCPGSTNTEIWDVSDPVAPTVITRIVNPMTYQHSAAVTDDGKLLVVGAEDEVSDCAGGPTGAMIAYDITNPQTPVPLGYYSIDRGNQPIGSPVTDRDTWCTAHIFDFIPGTYTMVASWYSSGMNVLDWSDPSAPEELAYYFASGEEQANYWSAYWYDGRIWANDRGIGALDVFTVKGLKEGGHH